MAAKKSKVPDKIPDYSELINPTLKALHELGGSATNTEIYEQVIVDMNLSDDVIDYLHKGNDNQTEVQYRLAWARTYLKKYGVIENTGRAVWIILPEYSSVKSVDVESVVKAVKAIASKNSKKKEINQNNDDLEDDGVEFPDEIEPWKIKLSEVLHNMNPYSFEKLAQRVLRESGFDDVKVTKKSGDGGIDGTGKLKINGMFSFNVAFQCKRYIGNVGSSDIRDFRGSLTTDIEKPIFITTGTFSRAAIEEASVPGKQQIYLINGEEFIDMLIKYKVGVYEKTIYEVDTEFFEKL